MHRSILTVDLGNTRCKLRRWRIDSHFGAVLESSAEFESQNGLAAEVRAWLEQGVRPGSAALCSVGRREVADALWSTLNSHVETMGERDLDPGLVNECRDPRGVGRDRLFAARGAVEIVGDSVIVIDAGTALTVDAVVSDRHRARPARFLGGSIAPGPKLLAQALAAGTANLPLVEPAPGVPAWGTDTVSAMRAGIGVGFRGAARELAMQLAEEVGLAADVPIAITGGARLHLLEPPLFTNRRVVVEHELVHLGLLAASNVPLTAKSIAR